METRVCTLCNVPIATGDCPHMLEQEGQVIMSKKAHESLVEELTKLRNLEAALEDKRWLD